MKTLKKVIRFLDRIEDAILGIAALLLFLVGAYGLYDSYMVYQNANDTSITKYKPGYEGETPDKPIVGHMVAWLTIQDTSIDYPVMQGKNNQEYLNKDPFGEFALSGSIFLDSRNDGTFQDPYSLIYGHHMQGGAMFGALDAYQEVSYAKAHTEGTLTVGETPYNIKLFALMETEGTNELIFMPGGYDKSQILAYIKGQAMIWEQTICAEAEEKPLVALSTCKYPNSAQRTIVIGVLEKE